MPRSCHGNRWPCSRHGLRKFSFDSPRFNSWSFSHLFRRHVICPVSKKYKSKTRATPKVLNPTWMPRKFSWIPLVIPAATPKVTQITFILSFNAPRGLSALIGPFASCGSHVVAMVITVSTLVDFQSRDQSRDWPCSFVPLFPSKR